MNAERVKENLQSDFTMAFLKIHTKINKRLRRKKYFSCKILKIDQRQNYSFYNYVYKDSSSSGTQNTTYCHKGVTYYVKTAEDEQV